MPVFLSVGYAACDWCHEVAAWAVIAGFQRNLSSVSGLIVVRIGSVSAGVGHRFRGLVHHSRASLEGETPAMWPEASDRSGVFTLDSRRRSGRIAPRPGRERCSST